MKIGRHRLLIYDYVPDILERRDPYRPGHLSNIERHVADGAVLVAGAVGDPPSAGHIVFGDVADDVVAAFVEADPYVTAGLVTAWRVEPWNVVASGV
jgi:uncharacterized protein YciI